jgi:hypothetical protein
MQCSLSFHNSLPSNIIMNFFILVFGTYFALIQIVSKCLTNHLLTEWNAFVIKLA